MKIGRDQRASAQRSRQGRAPQAGDDWRETRQFLASLSALLAVAQLTAETHALGLDFAERYTLSIDNAMIAAAATLAGCKRLRSQDMQVGMKTGDKLRVADPFK